MALSGEGENPPQCEPAEEREEQQITWKGMGIITGDAVGTFFHCNGWTANKVDSQVFAIRWAETTAASSRVRSYILTVESDVETDGESLHCVHTCHTRFMRMG